MFNDPRCLLREPCFAAAPGHIRSIVSRVVFAAVNMIDVISLWTLCLLVIGFGFVTRKSVSKAACAGTVFGVFLVYAVLRVMLASLRGF